MRGELEGGDDRYSSCADSAILGLAVYRALSLLVSMASIVTDGRRGGGLKLCVKLMGVCWQCGKKIFIAQKKFFIYLRAVLCTFQISVDFYSTVNS